MPENYIKINPIPALCDNSWKDLSNKTLPVYEDGTIVPGSSNANELTRFIGTNENGRQFAKANIILGDPKEGKAIIKNNKHIVVKVGQFLDPDSIKFILADTKNYKTKEELEELKIENAVNLQREPFELTKENNTQRTTDAFKVINQAQQKARTENDFWNNIKNEDGGFLVKKRLEVCGDTSKEQKEQIERLDSCKLKYEIKKEKNRSNSNMLTFVGISFSLTNLIAKLASIAGLFSLNPFFSTAISILGLGITLFGISLRSKDRNDQDNFMTECTQ